MHATYLHETYAKWPGSDIDTYTADGDCGDDDKNQCDYAEVTLQNCVLMAWRKERVRPMHTMVVRQTCKVVMTRRT